MLWYESWLDSRRWFLIAAAVSLIAAGGVVASYGGIPPLTDLGGGSVDVGASEGTVLEPVALGTLHDYVWEIWFDRVLVVLGVLFAAVLGSGDPVPRAFRGGARSTAHRSQWLVARAGVGVVQLLLLTGLPSLALSPLSSAIQQGAFPLAAALVHGLCAFAVTLLFFSIALLLSTWLGGYWRPLALTLSIGGGVAIIERVLQTPTAPFITMSGESYFRTGALPTEGLGASVALAAALLFVAIRRLERHGTSEGELAK